MFYFSFVTEKYPFFQFESVSGEIFVINDSLLFYFGSSQALAVPTMIIKDIVICFCHELGER